MKALAFLALAFLVASLSGHVGLAVFASVLLLLAGSGLFILAVVRFFRELK